VKLPVIQLYYTWYRNVGYFKKVHMYTSTCESLFLNNLF